jgi:type II secretory pathway component PulJ
MALERARLDQLTDMASRTEETVSNTATSRAAGFTLVEALVALSILTVGLLGLAQAFYVGMRHMSTSSANLIAREKAREAVESVHTARDTRTITWAQIKNVSNGGVFLDGAQDLRTAGTDGLVNTADDATTCTDRLTNPTCLETQRDPGPNRILGDADDVVMPLAGFSREIQILELNPVNPDLRQVVVTITFQVGPQRGTYTLRTYISAFS